MKKLFAGGFLFLIFALNLASCAAEEPPVIVIENKTGKNVRSMYIIEATNPEFGLNWLHGLPFENEQSMTVTLPHLLRDVKYYNLLLVAEDGTEYLKRIKVSGGDIVSVTPSDLRK